MKGAAKMGFLHIYCGDGKGKTTAALGLAIRAAGAGMRVHIIQLLKGSDTAELSVLREIPGITLTRCDRNYGFFNTMTDADKTEITLCHNSLLEEGYSLVRAGKVDMLIIDEFNAAYSLDLIDRKAAEQFLTEKPGNAELVITGRDPAEIFVEAADYVSEIKCVKHPYSQGVNARRGIEY